MRSVRATLVQQSPSARIDPQRILEFYGAILRRARDSEQSSRKIAAGRIFSAYRRAQRRARESVQAQQQQALATFFKELKDCKENYERSFQKEILETALQIAREVLQEEVQTNKASIRKRFQHLLNATGKTLAYSVLIHPTLVPLIRECTTAAIVPSPDLHIGDIAIHTATGRIQTDIKQHVQLIQEQLLSLAARGSSRVHEIS